MRPARGGYALVIVLVLITILLSLYGVVYRYSATALRVETVRSQQAVRDRGSMEALARGLALLETGLPPSDPYECATTVDTPLGPRSFTVIFTNEGGKNWSVRSVPTAAGSSPAEMPVSFAAP